MKLRTTLTAALLAIVSTGLFAGNDTDNTKDSQAIVRNSSKNSVYQLVYTSASTGTVKVSILDANGNLIMTDRILNSQDGFMRPYNFSGLAEGNYLIEVQDGKNTVKLPVTHKITSIEEAINVKIKALAVEKKFQLTMLGSSENGLQVDILDGANKLVYTDYIDAHNSFSKVYDLTKVKAENFTFEVKSSNKLISKEQF
jgi:hypothetical protein